MANKNTLRARRAGFASDNISNVSNKQGTCHTTTRDLTPITKGTPVSSARRRPKTYPRILPVTLVNHRRRWIILTSSGPKWTGTYA